LVTNDLAGQSQEGQRPRRLARRGVLARVLGPVFSARTWLAMTYLVSGLPIGVLTFALAVTGVALGIGLLPLALLGLPVLALTLVGCGSLGTLERRRAALMLGQVVTAPGKKAPSRPGWVPAVRAVLTDAARWRQVGAAALALPLAVVSFTVAISAWSVALALITLPAYNSALPKGGASAFGWVLKGKPALTGAALLGAALGLVAPYVTYAMTATHAWMGRQLLGPRHSMAARVGQLERTRSRMVVAADTERRRIERDLHDGAQARLVSLAMELGRAKARFDIDPEGAKSLVDQAHEEAKTALAELRTLVRGVHPPVLSDRGLDAALSGLAAVCPVPVSVEVQMAERPSSTVEAVAYFVVAEALTNVAKHSGAKSATVSVRSEGGSVKVVVRDDGRGGADVAGPGLTGLADRAQAVDGRLSITSPAGGPTVIEVELPCA
jgi:signal transduction histidine kinase